MKKKGGSSRFPARIKKIMQADEDVGKVAQATPLLVSKAVEMFMQSLVLASVQQAQTRGSRKVQAYHLKQAVMLTESFDFLKDIVTRIPDPITTAEEDLKPPKPKPTTSRAKPNRKPKDLPAEEQEEEEDEEEDEEDEEGDTEMNVAGSSHHQIGQAQNSEGTGPIPDEDEDDDDDEEYY